MTKELKALITLTGKVDPSLQKTLLDAQKLTKTTSKSFWSLQNIGQKSMGLLKTGAKALGVGLVSLAVIGVSSLGVLGETGLQTASDLAEVQNVVDVTFGDSAAKIDKWSQSVLNSYGLSELSAKQYSSTMGAMLKSSGIANDDLLAMSQNVTMLTGDMASFYNQDTSEMFAKIRSGISGETEPLKQLGINMSAANLEAYALAQGMNKSYGSMSQAEQMTLRYNYLLQATADAQGDFSRTSDSMANQQKLLKENFTQLAGKIMTGAIPSISKLLVGLNQMVTGMDTEAIGGFVSQVAALAVELLPIAMQILPVIQNLITTILPPLIEIVKVILPPITKFLNFVINVIGKLLGAGKGVWDGLVNLFGGGKSSPSQAVVKGYAKGGFASRPAIFGEAGLEAAIPIKRGNPRSMMLLQKTAQLLGVSFGGGVHLTYAPVITGGDPESINPILRQHSDELSAMLDRRENRRRRLSFALA